MQKCISITDSRVIDKLKTVSNQSAYIQELIIKDIVNPNYNPNEFIDIIKELLIENSRPIVDVELSEDAFASVIDIE
ncbi:MAG: hypothetical protein ACRDDX_10645 [Cellulosilyticaceae bacterium]